MYSTSFFSFVHINYIFFFIGRVDLMIFVIQNFLLTTKNFFQGLFIHFGFKLKSISFFVKHPFVYDRFIDFALTKKDACKTVVVLVCLLYEAAKMYFEYKFICIQKRKEEKNGFRKADMLIFCCRFFLKGVRKDLIKLKKN